MTRYNFDLHFHSCLSPCGSDDMTPATIAGFCAINDINIAALTDHNTCRNCESFLKAAMHYGILGIPGMELTTAEEIHVICLFKELDSAMSFSKYVASHLPKIENRSDLFGNQLVMDVEDNVIGIENSFLAGATDIGIFDVTALVKRFNGIAFPAHIDRPSFSLISNLGMWDNDLGFSIAEISLDAKKNKFLYLQEQNCVKIITNSDAHYLNQIIPAHQSIELEDFNTECFFNKLSYKKEDIA